jgi:threonine dehydrogenase-like Zn-dependent dehydrogenase
MTARIATHKGARVIGVDLVPERLELAQKHGIETLDLEEHEDVSETIREMTEGRGTDAAIDAVGMEAHGAPVGELAQKAAGLLPDKLAEKLIEKAAIDRMSALYECFDSVRRGGTVSISGVYGGMVDPIPMMQLFDKGVQLRMGQAHVKRWIDEIMPLVSDEADPLGTEDLASHKIGIADVPDAYETFQKKEDGAIKFVIQP